MKINLRLPLNYDDISMDHQCYFCDSFEYKPQPVRKIKNAFVTNNGIVLEGISYVKESFYEPLSYRKKYWFYALKRKVLSEVSRWGKEHLFKYDQNVPVGIIHQPYINYFHFTIESLTRWIILNKEYPSAKILIPEELLRISYINQWLDLLQINVIRVPEFNNIKVNQLLVPTIVRWAGNHNVGVLQELRDRTLEAISKVNENKLVVPSRIFIVRKGRRQIKNLLEVENCLKKYDISFIDFDGMSVVQQLQMVQDAELIIGQHGAGLTNIVFAKENCNVIEIFIDPKEVNGIIDDEYYRIFSQLNFSYYCLFSNTASEKKDFYSSDIKLNIHELEKVVKVILNKNNVSL
jgi:capsular polysaccharide biosynthesis protein